MKLAAIKFMPPFFRAAEAVEPGKLDVAHFQSTTHALPQPTA